MPDKSLTEQIAKEILDSIGRDTPGDCGECHYSEIDEQLGHYCSYEGGGLCADMTRCPQDWAFCLSKTQTVLSLLRSLTHKDLELKDEEIRRIPSGGYEFQFARNVAQAQLAKASVKIAALEEENKRLRENSVKLAKDQSLPELYPEEFSHGMLLPDQNELQRYRNAMNWLIHERGFRRIENLDSLKDKLE